jgi:hypothetical protein
VCGLCADCVSNARKKYFMQEMSISFKAFINNAFQSFSKEVKFLSLYTCFLGIFCSEIKIATAKTVAIIEF